VFLLFFVGGAPFHRLLHEKHPDLVMLKGIKREFRKILHPKSVMNIKINDKTMPEAR
jgi:hypothetical protein